jgi:hypothetical protein
VAKGMRCYRLGEFRHPMCLAAGGIHGACRYRFSSDGAGKHPCPGWSHGAPIVRQHLQQPGRQHDVAVFLSLCVRKNYVAEAARRQLNGSLASVGRNITFATSRQSALRNPISPDQKLTKRGCPSVKIKGCPPTKSQNLCIVNSEKVPCSKAVAVSRQHNFCEHIRPQGSPCQAVTKVAGAAARLVAHRASPSVDVPWPRPHQPDDDATAQPRLPHSRRSGRVTQLGDAAHAPTLCSLPDYVAYLPFQRCFPHKNLQSAAT